MKQPRVPEYREADGVARYIKSLILFLKDFTMAAWTANNQRKKEIENVKASIPEMPEIPEINYPVTSVNGKTGDVNLTSKDVGIDHTLRKSTYILAYPASGWQEREDGGFSQAVSAPGMTKDDWAHVDVDMSGVQADESSSIVDTWAMITRAETEDGGLLLVCHEERPEMDITVKVEVIR